MSTARLKPFADKRHTRIVGLALGLLAATALSPAQALESDRTQPIRVQADSAKSTTDGRAVLIGAVVVTQGSLEAHASKGTAYSDAGKVVRIVLLGAPATFAQALDAGGRVHAAADHIEYQVGADTIVLSGHAHVEQTGKAEYSGARLVYNTSTGAISGNGGNTGQVELILQPRTSAPVPAESPPAAPTTAVRPKTSGDKP